MTGDDGDVVVIELHDPDDGPVRLEPGGRCRSDVLAPAWALPG